MPSNVSDNLTTSLQVQFYYFSDFAYIVSEKRNKLEIEDNIFPNPPFAQDKNIIWELISSYSIGSQQLSNC